MKIFLGFSPDPTRLFIKLKINHLIKYKQEFLNLTLENSYLIENSNITFNWLRIYRLINKRVNLLLFG